VKSRFQNLPFKCNLQRYTTVGGCTCTAAEFSSVTHIALESAAAWFQTQPSFKCFYFMVSIYLLNLCRYYFVNLCRYAAADVLAAKDDWPKIYDFSALNANTVPVACASYFEDMFVDFDLAQVRGSGAGRGAQLADMRLMRQLHVTLRVTLRVTRNTSNTRNSVTHYTSGHASRASSGFCFFACFNRLGPKWRPPARRRPRRPSRGAGCG
jgi:hypothetical protein